MTAMNLYVNIYLDIFLRIYLFLISIKLLRLQVTNIGGQRAHKARLSSYFDWIIY